MISQDIEEQVREKFVVLSPLLDERLRRLWAAAEAMTLGSGGIAAVERATGLTRGRIRRGKKELKDPLLFREVEERIRRPGAGRPSIAKTNPGIVEALEALVEPVTRGDPMSPLRWTSKSTRKLAAELRQHGYSIERQKVSELLGQLGYSLQGTRKTEEGAAHPERDAQFQHINRQVTLFQRQGEPAISVDTKKKELVGNYQNAGREWRPSGDPERVNVHDFRDPDVAKAIPYGVYDIRQNAGWVTVGTDHDTPDFAVASIRQWWLQMGRRTYPDATKLLITADAGGSNSYRARAWKTALQRLADDTRLALTVCHFPPGTSKWNKIEHRMFCHITENWRGQPLLDYQVIVNLIGRTTTTKGLRIKAKLDRRRYPKGVKVSDADLASVNLKQHRFHGEWNYTILPRSTE